MANLHQRSSDSRGHVFLSVKGGTVGYVDVFQHRVLVREREMWTFDFEEQGHDSQAVKYFVAEGGIEYKKDPVGKLGVVN